MRSIRLLKTAEIELRPQCIKDGKCTLVPFIDSRSASALLDETYGKENWNLEYKAVNDAIYGRLSIWDEEKQRYVYREDTGEEANISKDKSLASDILKRLIVRFGVSELYTAPRITIPDDGYGNTGYKVLEIEYNEHREICHLVIVNRFGKEVYRMNPDNMVQEAKPISKQIQSCDNKEAVIQSIKAAANKEWCKDGVNRTELQKFVAFYTKKVEKDGWNGEFQFNVLFNSWMSRACA